MSGILASQPILIQKSLLAPRMTLLRLRQSSLRQKEATCRVLAMKRLIDFKLPWALVS